MIERNDPVNIGKGYALAAGVKYLGSTRPPSIVVFVDADCMLGADTINSLARACIAQNRPIQGLDLIKIPEDADVRQRNSAFAWRVKNQVRPTGYRALGLPCLLMGTGMAIPFDMVKQINLATDHIAEDTVIGLNFALIGHPPMLCPNASVTSEFAPSEAGRELQKSRWIHGQLSAISEFVPKLVTAAIHRRDHRFLALAADLLVPPLGFLLAVVVAFNLTTFFWFVATGFVGPQLVALASLCICCIALVATWAMAGRDLIEFRDFGEFARHAARQLSVIKGYIAGRRSKWTRSERRL